MQARQSADAEMASMKLNVIDWGLCPAPCWRSSGRARSSTARSVSRVRSRSAEAELEYRLRERPNQRPLAGGWRVRAESGHLATRSIFAELGPQSCRSGPAAPWLIL